MDVQIAAHLFKKKALHGLLALSARRVVIQIIQTVANIILARTLFPSDFGVFALIFFYVTIFELVADFGLNASLLQRDKEPRAIELRNIFTIHLLLGGLAFLLMLLSAPLFLNIYKMQLGQHSQLIVLSSLAPILYNLRLIPHSILERKLEYKRLVIGEILEVAILELVTVSLALTGLGVASFVWGLLASRLAAGAIFFKLSPWRIGFYFSFDLLRPYLKFGIPYQVNHVIGVINGALAPVVVGGLVGTTALGLVNWAGGVAALPRAIGEVVARLIFPVGARIQKNKKLLKNAFEKAIELTNTTSFPIVAIILALAKPITYIIFTGRWEKGISSLYIFTLGSVFVVLGVVLTNFLLALGEAKVVRNINLFGVILQWVLTVPLVKLLGFVGYPIATLAASGSFFIFLVKLKKLIPINFSGNTLPYLFYSVVSGFSTYFYSRVFVIESFGELILAAFVGFFVYAIFLLLFKRKFIDDLRGYLSDIIRT